jgi:hypothetical protein
VHMSLPRFDESHDRGSSPLTSGIIKGSATDCNTDDPNEWFVRVSRIVRDTYVQQSCDELRCEQRCMCTS